MTNPIIDEIRAARAALAEEHDYDLVRINEWARRQTDARRQHAATQPKANKVMAPTTEAVLSAPLSVTPTRSSVPTLAPGTGIGIGGIKA